MPKKPPRDNRNRPELRTVHTAGASAAALLQRITRRAQVLLPAVSGAVAGGSWLERLREGLPEEQRRHLVDVLEKEQGLLLFVDSAAWAGRIRLSLPDLAGLSAGRRLDVRLAPRKAARAGQ